ncbi:MAG TPA: hypothetical protein VFT74_20325 [Isosphaeraceae bacterium]|nr:hypothetical protein [Isosphaeraceae bacterium]
MSTREKDKSTNKGGPKPRLFEFTLILSPLPEDLTDEQLGRLYESGCDDALIGRTAGVWHAVFGRESSSFAEAVVSAIKSVEGADVGLTVEWVDTDDVEVSTGQIAERLGVSRETVRLWATGKDGPTGFPPPVAIVGRTPVYRWPDVAAWLRDHRGGQARVRGIRLDDNPDMTFIEYLNTRLRLRRLAARISEGRAEADRFFGANY